MARLPIQSITASEKAAVALIASCWLGIYVWRALVGHWSLGTSAYDLSVFDYALWSIGQDGTMQVPFLGHALSSHHFMPVLYVLWPIYTLLPSATFLLVFQLALTASGAVLLHVSARKLGANPWIAVCVTFVYLWSRRTHSAVADSFYPEHLQAVLTFAIICCWSSRPLVFWTVTILMLMTKEDAAIYTAALALGATVYAPADRHRAGRLMMVSVAWFAVAVFVAVPLSRIGEGLSPSNPLIQARFGEQGDLSGSFVAHRVFSTSAVGVIANLVVTGGLLPIAAPHLMLPALPGVLINVAADPASMQAALKGHYAWPVLPWIFLAAAAGATRAFHRAPRVTTTWLIVLLVATLVDSPSIRRIPATAMSKEATSVRAQLPSLLEVGTVVLAQPNLIPHLPHHADMFAVGSDVAPPRAPDLVLLTNVGNTWPLDKDGVNRIIAQYQADPRYEGVTTNGLHAFRLKSRQPR